MSRALPPVRVTLHRGAGEASPPVARLVGDIIGSAEEALSGQRTRSAG